MCFAGSIRDVILMRNFDLLTIIGSFFVVMLIYNIATGNFTLAFDTPGVIAHSEHLWNILGMYAVGFAAVLAGGCPLRQLILAGQGSSDSAMTVTGMFIGAALAHNLGLAASATALNTETQEVAAGSVPLNGKVAVIICIAVCFCDRIFSIKEAKINETVTIGNNKEKEGIRMKEVDARGLSCPEPMMLTRKKRSKSEKGAIRILVTEPHQRMNVEKCARDHGREYTSTETEDGFGSCDRAAEVKHMRKERIKTCSNISHDSGCDGYGESLPGTGCSGAG